MFSSENAGFSQIVVGPSCPGCQDQVAPLKTTIATQDNRISLLFPDREFYVSGDFTICSMWLRCYKVNSRSPNPLKLTITGSFNLFIDLSYIMSTGVGLSLWLP